MAKKGAPYNNKNAAGDHKPQYIEYKTGVLGMFGMGKTHSTIGFKHPVSGMTHFPNPLPKNTTYIKSFDIIGVPKGSPIAAQALAYNNKMKRKK
jgi:hypothetical protein